MGNTRLLTSKSFRLVSQEVSDLWKATIPYPVIPVNISDIFSQREFTAALRHLKQGKAPGPDSICLELIIHAGAASKTSCVTFFPRVCADSKFPRSGEERFSCDPKADEA